MKIFVGDTILSVILTDQIDNVENIETELHRSRETRELFPKESKVSMVLSGSGTCLYINDNWWGPMVLNVSRDQFDDGWDSCSFG